MKVAVLGPYKRYVGDIVYKSLIMERRRLFIQKLHSLKSLQRSFITATAVSNPLPYDHYDSLQLLMLQVTPFPLHNGELFPSCYHIQECDGLGLQRNTKFLAKVYFDLAVSRLEQLNHETAALYLLTAMCLAVKFNENRQRSHSFSLNPIAHLPTSPFQHADFLRAEQQLLALLDYRLQIVTPYDYAVLFRELLSKYQNRRTIELKIITLVDFAISLPSLSLQSPLCLYWACFLEVIQWRLRREDLDEISECISDKEEVRRVREVLKFSMEKVLREQKLSDGDLSVV